MKKQLFLSFLTFVFFVSSFSAFASFGRINAAAPIVHEEVASGTANNMTAVTSGALLGSEDGFYIATIANYQNKAVANVSGLGLTWTQAVNQCSARNAQGLQFWYAKGPSLGGQVTANFTVATQVGLISVSRYSGVDAVNSFVDAHGENQLGVSGPCSGGTDTRPAVITTTPVLQGSVRVVAVNSRTRSITSYPSNYTQNAYFNSGASGAVTTLSVYNSPVTTVNAETASFNLSGTTDWATSGLVLQPSTGTPDPEDPISYPDSFPVSYPEDPEDPQDPNAHVLVGAGNISKCSWSTDELTANLLDDIDGTVYTLGDHAYEHGTASEFNDCYNPSWGRHKARTMPTVGNTDYETPNASGYFNYFGAVAGDPSKGYYSYDVGDWHVVVLNSNCSEIGTCKRNSPQDLWLKADLAANAKTCTVAMWHHASFSSSGNSTRMRYLWETLYNYNADLVLTAHHHFYERFAPQTALGALDESRGLRQFVVGTGGASFSNFDFEPLNTEVRNNETHGVLKLTLHENSYDWEFVPVAGQTFTDSGSDNCH